MKTKSDKNLFRKLNERSKELQVKQEVIAKRHNLLVAQCDELVQLGNIEVKEGQILRKRIKYLKRLRGKIMVGVVVGRHRLFFASLCLRKQNIILS